MMIRIRQLLTVVLAAVALVALAACGSGEAVAVVESQAPSRSSPTTPSAAEATCSPGR